MVAVSGAVGKHLTDINEWRRLGEANVFAPDSRLELIEGEIIDMAPIGFNHAGHLKRLNKVFFTLTQNIAISSVQDPVRLGNFSEPEPDFMLLKLREDFYCASHPTAEDVLLLIEISDRSLLFDQTQKLRLYAQHQIPDYWIVNLNQSCLEIYREPIGGNYAQKTTLRRGESVTLSQLPNISVAVSELL